MSAQGVRWRSTRRATIPRRGHSRAWSRLRPRRGRIWSSTSVTITIARPHARQVNRVARAVPGATAGMPGMQICSRRRERCSPPRRGSWCAAITSRAIAPGRAGGAFSIRGRWSRAAIAMTPPTTASATSASPYAIPLRADAQFIVFDSSKVGVAPLAVTDPMYKTYMAQMRRSFELGAGVAHNFFMNHHPILGFAPNPTQTPTGLYPGNGSLQSVLVPINGERLFPSNFEALISGHIHLFEVVSYSTPQPTQLISGNGGAWADVALPRQLPQGATPSPGALIGSIVSTNQSGFMTIERDADGAWRIEARDRQGRLFTTCTLRDARRAAHRRRCNETILLAGLLCATGCHGAICAAGARRSRAFPR